MVTSFTSSLISLAQQCSPQQNHSTHPAKKNMKFISSWSENCSTTTKDRRRALKKLKSNENIENFIDYCKKRAKSRWTLKQAKRNSRKELISTINTHQPQWSCWYGKKLYLWKNLPLFTHLTASTLKTTLLLTFLRSQTHLHLTLPAPQVMKTMTHNFCILEIQGQVFR